MRIRMQIVVVMIVTLLFGSLENAHGQATDSLTVSEKMVITSSFASGFRGELWRNPALYYYYTPFSWTNLDVNGAYHDKGRASLKQEGDEDSHVGLDVSSFVVLSDRNRVFGSAGYKSENKENVVWNENIDWQMVAPYVTGDSIGGFLKGETYYFAGGYAAESGRWSWGVKAGYRASHNYRDKDPRPRNTASDLSASAGAGYILGDYRLGLSADFRLYQQNCEISFLADKGSTSVYHILGLGMDYVRFAGNQTSTKYQGIQWGGSIGLLPVGDKRRLSATVAVDHISLDKKLSSANNLTLLNLSTTEVSGNVTWMRKSPRAENVAVKVDAGYTMRKGTENIYGEAGGNSYGTLISKSPGIKTASYRAGVSGLWERLLTDSRKWGGAVMPSVVYHRSETDYSAVARYVHLSALESLMRARLQYCKNLLRLTAEVNGGYYANLSSEYSLPGLNALKSLSETLLANINYLSDSYGTAGVRLQGDYPIIPQYCLSLSVQWQTSHYKKCGTSQYVACSLGLFF